MASMLKVMRAQEWVGGGGGGDGSELGTKV